MAWRLATAAASFLLFAGGSALVMLTSPAAASAATSFVKVSARPTLPTRSVSLGALASTKTISGDVALVPRDAAALHAYASGVSVAGSPYYHHYLDLAALDAEFAPSRSTVTGVEKELKAGGLKVTSVSNDDLLVGFKGSASRVEATFDTRIDSYRLTSGRTAFANTSAAEMRGAVAGHVEGVIGLNDLLVPEAAPILRSDGTSKASSEKTVPLTAPAGSASACAAATDVAVEASGLTATQVAYSYGLDPLYSDGDFGAGATVDILDLFGYNSSDVSALDDCYYGSSDGAKVFANDSVTNVDGGAQPGNAAGAGSETDLDVDTVNAYAPGAKVDVYEAPNSDSGFLDDIAAMAASSAKIESISYGQCEQAAQLVAPGYTQMENYLFEESAAMGKTVFASAGDAGDDTCSLEDGVPGLPVLSADDPASQPFVTAVGGTAITAATDPPAEEVWNDGAAGGAGGGGISDIWQEPAWQANSKVPGLNNKSVIDLAEEIDGDGFCQDTYGTSVNCREEPDVSAQASPNTGGFPIVLDGSWTLIGGTSLATPTWGAITADIDSTKACTASGGVGFISPKLYAIASIPKEYAASFTDVTVGDNDNYGAADGLFPATTGYDMASGLGSPKVTGAGGTDGLAYYLCTTPSPTPPTVTGLSPVALSSSEIAGSTTLTISGSGFYSSGTSDVAAVSIGSVTLPSSDVDVTSSTSISLTLPTTLLASEEGNGGTGDGTGTYDVTVTLAGGTTSAPNAKATLVIYASGSSGGTPQVDGTFPSAGVEAGGTSVTVYGSGFTEGTVASVTFGGSPAASFKVDNDNTITATTPAEPSASACVSGDDPATGVCQVQVQVTMTGGAASTEGTIPLEYSGAVTVYETEEVNSSLNDVGLYAAPTEFDYEPPPTITSISYVTPPNEASEAGGTEIELEGTGLGPLGFDWLNVGSYLNNLSEDYPPSYVSSTEMVIALPPEPATSTPLNVPVTVQTYGSPNVAPGKTLSSVAPSDTVDVTYAPTPSVTTIQMASGSKYLAGPTSGGTDLIIHGHGFDGAELVAFEDLKYGFISTQYVFDQISNSEIELATPSNLTGVDEVGVCNAFLCSGLTTNAFTFYLPGSPVLTANTPKTGKAGTKVTIEGDNLGYVEDVYFGTKLAKFSEVSTLFESGDTYEIKATAPKGASGKVDIRVETLESLATGYGKSRVNKSVTFTYDPKKKK